jgi:hypothetical protein
MARYCIIRAYGGVIDFLLGGRHVRKKTGIATFVRNDPAALQLVSMIRNSVECNVACIYRSLYYCTSSLAFVIATCASCWYIERPRLPPHARPAHLVPQSNLGSLRSEITLPRRILLRLGSPMIVVRHIPLNRACDVLIMQICLALTALHRLCWCSTFS